MQYVKVNVKVKVKVKVHVNAGLENIQLVCSMSSRQALGRHRLSPRFASIVRVACVGFAEREQLQAAYSAYLRAILSRQLAKHPFWQSAAKVHALAGSMLELFERMRASFSQVPYELHCTTRLCR